MRPRAGPKARPWARLLAVACTALPAAAAQDVSPPGEQEQPASTRAMAERLEEIARQVHIETQPFVNDRRVPYCLTQLRRARSPAERTRWHTNYARELLLAGRTEEAIEQLETLQRSRSTRGSRRRRVQELLAVAYLRLGEQENCVAHHGIDSCLLPIRGSGVHTRTRGSLGAREQLLAALEQDPEDLEAVWLLNIAAMTLGEHPDGVPERWRIPPERFLGAPFPRFHDVASRAGVAALGLAGGSVMEDFDGDGLLDILCSSWGLRDPMHLYRSRGDGTFEDRTEAAGLLGEVGGLVLNHSDYDNDGDADVFVMRGAWLFQDGEHPDSLLRNEGDGTFTDVTEEAGLLHLAPTSSSAWADLDGDGWLDLYVAGESTRARPHPCRLYHNNGDGTFTDVAERCHAAEVSFVKGVAAGDYDNDGRPDLYLSRLAQDNLLLHNEGPAPGDPPGIVRFRDVTEAAGVAGPSLSFPTWFFDYDNDGWLDLLVAGYYDFVERSAGGIARLFLGQDPGLEVPRLYHNEGDGSFTDVTESAGLGRVVLVMGANFGDLDNDGWLDCYFGTGDPDLRSLLPNVMLRNRGDGTFEDVSAAGGFGHVQKGHGVSFGDLDNDGDQDLYHVLGGAYSGDVYQNALFENPGSGNHWITLRLRGRASNRAGVGARVQVTVERPDGSLRAIHRVVGTGGSFGSSSLQLEVGLGDAARIEELRVAWPSGQEQRFPDVPLDRVLRVDEDEDELAVVTLPRLDLSPDSRSE